MRSWIGWMLIAMLAVSLGCTQNPPGGGSGETPQTPTQPTADPDDAEAAAAIGALTKKGGKVEKDGNGNIVKVDFTKILISDDEIAPVEKLLQLKYLVLLNSDTITDETLLKLGDLKQLKLLDVRGCFSVSDAGLEGLKGVGKR